MTLAKLIEKFEGKPMPTCIRRKAWFKEDDQLFCYPAYGQFYTSNDRDQHYPFDHSDLTANDWEYVASVWTSK